MTHSRGWEMLLLTGIVSIGAHACISLAWAGMGSGGTDEGPDSTGQRYTLPEIVVTATRNESITRDLPSAVSVLDLNDLQIVPGSLVTDALAGIPGLTVRAYGGGVGVQSVSLRGMSPENTLVLVDGYRLNSVQNGQVDFGLLPVANVERIEVAKGGYSSLYGADAVGGVVNIFTRKPGQGFSARLAGTLGAADYVANEASVGDDDGNGYWRAFVRREQGSGEYAYDFNDGTTTVRLKRNGADFTTLRAEAGAGIAFSHDVRSSLLVSYGDGDRGSPGPVTYAGAQGKARLTDRLLRTHLGVDFTLSGSTNLRIGTAYTTSDQHYTDPAVLLDGKALETSSADRTVMVLPEVRYTPSELWSAVGGGEISGSWAQGNQVGDARRWVEGIYLSTQHTLPLPWTVPFALSVYPSLRYDHLSDVAGDVSPRIGVNVGILAAPDIRLRSSYGKSFRAPTFNDMYWSVGGNPDLRPERSLSFDAGVVSTFHLLGDITVDVSYFSITTRDRILWIPTSGEFWSPSNIGEVRSKGLEAEVRWALLDADLVLTINATWADVSKTGSDVPGDRTVGNQLPYSPRQTATFSADYRLDAFHAYVKHSWMSYRFTSEANDQFLPSYGTTSAAVQYTLEIDAVKALAKIEGTNLFNTTYQVIALYPMPLREVRVTLGVEL